MIKRWQDESWETSPPGLDGIYPASTNGTAATSLWDRSLANLADDVQPREAIAETATCTLLEFCKEFWPIVEPGHQFKSNWHIEAICDHLEALSRLEIRDLIINVPPRCMKSLTSSVFWFCWVWTWDPSSRWIYASYQAELSKRDSLKCRNIVQSPRYRSAFGNVFRLSGDQNLKTKFENNRTGFRIATSVAGLGTGEGGEYIAVDDPHNVRDAESDKLRESVVEWWLKTMSSRFNDPKLFRKLVNHQRVHELDLTGQILAKELGYVHLCLPMHYNPKSKCRTIIGFEDPRTEEGQLLWPDRLDEVEVKKLEKELGSHASSGQLEQDPKPADGGVIKKWWWRYWVPRGSDLAPVMVKLPSGEWFKCPQVELPDSFEELIQSWDMAFKDLATSDYVAGQIWARLAADKFMLDYQMEKMDFVASKAAVVMMTRKWPNAALKLVEDAANGPAIMQSLRNTISGLIPVPTYGGLNAKFNAASPEVESGNVYLPHPMIRPEIDGFIARASSYPGCANDDDLAAFSQAILRLSKRLAATGSGGKKKNRSKN